MSIQERYTGAVMNTFGPPALALVRGKGAHVWDADGKEYVDLLGGIAVNALGHAHPALVEAVTTQLSTLGHVSNFFATEPQVSLAERLLSLLGWSDGRVFFSNSGAEANEAALKLSRRTGRTRLVAAEGSFHGRTMGALALTSKAAYREPFEPLPGEVTFVPYDDVAALETAVDDTVAAVVLEPFQGEAGVVVPSPGYLAAAQRIARDAGALFWLDEVQTGIGRTGAWFAHHLVAAEGAFHGRTMGALALTHKPAAREPFEPLPGHVTFVPYGDSEALAAAGTDETAAVVLEPVQGEAGVVVPPDGYLADARRITGD
ncbi:MAG TPA: aminotransferase class III-fold pyridoxal phosphate-dependent enzyme, partial [Nocardioides sp.]